MNRDVEQQVWQRVLGQSESPRRSLRPMELEAMEAAAVYRKLAGQFSGRGREQLRASARYADGDSRLSAGDRAAVRQWGQKNSADRRSGGAGSEGAGKAVSLRPACSDGVYGADGGRGFRHCVSASCGPKPGGVRSAGPSAGGTGAEHFTIIGKKTKPGHDPPQGSHVPVFSILNVPDLCQVADMHARRDRKFRGIARFICPERRICSAQRRFRRFSAPSGTLPWRESCRAR